MRPYFVRTIASVLTGFLLLSVTLVAQTTQDPSIADAARANRQQKKTVPQSSKVITNDSLGPSSTTSSGSNTMAQSAPSASSERAPSSPDAKSAATTESSELSPADEEKLKAQVASLKQQLKDEQGELELQKHLVDLDKDAYFSQTDFAHDTQGKAKLDAEQDDLKKKEEAFEALKAKLLSVAPQEALAPAPAEQTKP